MNIQHATIDDLDAYLAMAREAQDWLRSQGLSQYVPAAQEQYEQHIRESVARLRVVRSDRQTVGFFTLNSSSPWWPNDNVVALYLGGVVAERGRGIGSVIIHHCVREANGKMLRLECHAGNPRLCKYYESHGFVSQGQAEQHPGYFGVLYQRLTTIS